jgi:hypothetical protein
MWRGPENSKTFGFDQVGPQEVSAWLTKTARVERQNSQGSLFRAGLAKFQRGLNLATRRPLAARRLALAVFIEPDGRGHGPRLYAEVSFRGCSRTGTLLDSARHGSRRNMQAGRRPRRARLPQYGVALGSRQRRGGGRGEALTYYSSLVSKILGAEPVACFRALFRAADAPRIVNYRTMQPLPEMAADLERDPSTSGAYVRRMASAPEAITGPLICTCEGDLVQGVLEPRSAFLLFDGFHRGAAWILQGKAGRVNPISARIIVTKWAARLGQGGA